LQDFFGLLEGAPALCGEVAAGSVDKKLHHFDGRANSLRTDPLRRHYAGDGFSILCEFGWIIEIVFASLTQ
jgi:hypothetical protein